MFFEKTEKKDLQTSQVESIFDTLIRDPELSDFLQNLHIKVQIKQQVSYDDGTNYFSEYKRIGIFIVHWQYIPEKLANILRFNGIDIKPNDVGS